MKIAILGLGSIGLRHAKNLLSLGHQVIGYDPDVERVKLFLKEQGAAAVCNSKGDYDHDIDAVVVATPSPNHLNDTLRAIKLGKPVFVEKPISTTWPDAWQRELLADKVTMVGNNLRFHSCVRQATEWLAEGLIGTPYRASFVLSQASQKPSYLQDGVLLNWGSHEIDLAIHLLGPATVACSHTVLHGGKDTLADITLQHTNGCISTIHLDFIGLPKEERRFDINGNKNSIHVDLLRRYASTNTSSGLLMDNFDKNYLFEMETFIDKIQGQTTLGASGKDGLETLRICLAVREDCNDRTKKMSP